MRALSFWKRRWQRRAEDAAPVQKTEKSIKGSPPVAMEVKILPLEALDAGLSADEVSELVGVVSSTLDRWRKEYAEGDVGVCSSSPPPAKVEMMFWALVSE